MLRQSFYDMLGGEFASKSTGVLEPLQKHGLVQRARNLSLDRLHQEGRDLAAA